MSELNLLMAANAWASSASADHQHVPTIGEVILPAINFIIYAGVLYYFALPLIRNFLRARREEIVTTIAQASAKKQQAEAMVSEYRAKVAGVEKEVQSIQASRRADAEREKARTLSEAEAIAMKIREDARFLAEREVVMAREKLRAELADRAELAARELVQKNISAADQGRLAHEFIQQIGQPR